MTNLYEQIGQKIRELRQMYPGGTLSQEALAPGVAEHFCEIRVVTRSNLGSRIVGHGEIDQERAPGHLLQVSDQELADVSVLFSDPK